MTRLLNCLLFTCDAFEVNLKLLLLLVLALLTHAILLRLLPAVLSLCLQFIILEWADHSTTTSLIDLKALLNLAESCRASLVERLPWSIIDAISITEGRNNTMSLLGEFAVLSRAHAPAFGLIQVEAIIALHRVELVWDHLRLLPDAARYIER